MMANVASGALAHQAYNADSTIASLPGLAAMLRRVKGAGNAEVVRLDPGALAQVYRIPHGDAAAESNSASHVIRHLIDRLRRLPRSYAEWTVFDAPAYFDLTVEQASKLLTIDERIVSVHVVVYADILLPSFQRAAATVADRFAPAHAILRTGVEPAERFFQQVQPAMIADWQRVDQVVRTVREMLSDDIGFLAANSANDERGRWRWAWQQPAAASVDALLLPPLARVPTLTLCNDFPLPAFRQPGRQRRLRLNRERQRRRRQKR